MHDRLIVGFDGSAASLAALDWAGEEAATRGASVRAISSYAMPPVMDYYGVGTPLGNAAEMHQLQKACENALSIAVAAAARVHPSVGFDFHAAALSPGRVLVDEASSADLLVVGSNGLGAAKSFLLGSVVAFVLHQSPCPVVVVPAERRPRVGSVVVGIDGSEHSSAALHWAADEADRRRAQLVVVHAWEYPYRVSAEGPGLVAALAEVDASIVLERDLEAARGRMAETVTGQLVRGEATQSLLTASETADLLVVGSRGRGGFRSMLLGSVAHAVAAHASCPVVVVR